MFKFRNKTIDCGLYLSKVSNKNARTVLMDLVLMFHFFEHILPYWRFFLLTLNIHVAVGERASFFTLPHFTSKFNAVYTKKKYLTNSIYV